MSRVALAILVVLALAHMSSVCDAGVLSFLGEKSQQLKNDTKVVIVEAEKRIKGLFGVVEPGMAAPATPATTSKGGAKSDGVETTTVDIREILSGAPRCAGDEEWDSDSESCVPELG